MTTVIEHIMITSLPTWREACKRMGITDNWAQQQKVRRAKKVYDAIMSRHLSEITPLSERIMPPSVAEAKRRIARAMSIPPEMMDGPKV